MRKIPSLREIIREEQQRNSRNKATSAVPTRPASMAAPSIPPPPLAIASTDDLTEGATNLFFTDARVYTFLKAALLGSDAVTITPNDGAQTLTITVDVGELSNPFDQTLNTTDIVQFLALLLTSTLTHPTATATDITLRSNAGAEVDGFNENHEINYPGEEGQTKDYIVWEKTDYNHEVPDGGFVWVGTGTGGRGEWFRLSAAGVRPTNGLLAPDGTAPQDGEVYSLLGSTQGYHSLAALLGAATEKETLVDADKFPVLDSEASGALKYVTKANMPSGGATDHGALTGLGDDDHPQYLLAENAPTAALATSAVTRLIVATDGNDSNNGVATSISGTVSVAAGNAAITGSGTSFTTELAVGNYVMINAEARKITSITDNTHAATTTNFTLTANNVTAMKCAAPKLTLQGTINSIPQFVNHVISIYVAPGTYAEAVSIAGFCGSGMVRMYGANASTTTTHACLSITIQQCGCYVQISGFDLTATATACVIVTGSPYVYLQYLNMVGSGANNGLQASFGNVDIFTCTISNRSNAVNAMKCGRITVSTLSGSGNTNVLTAGGGIIQKMNNTMPAGTNPESYSPGGLIVRSSGGVIGTS